MADETNDIRSLLDKLSKEAAGGAKDTPGGSHKTEQDLKEDAKDQSEEKETDDTVEDVGEPNVEEGKTEPEKDNPPAQVEEEASTDQSGDTSTPGGSHETEKDLKEDPNKKAELAQKIAEQKDDVVNSLDSLLDSVEKESADEKQEGEDMDEESDTSEESSDSSSDSDSGSDGEEGSDSEGYDKEDEETSNGGPAKQAGREAAQRVALLAYQQGMQEKQAELEKFAQMGAADASALADQMDAAVNQAVGGGAPAEGAPPEGGAPEGESTKSLEEVRAVAQTLIDGKEPETPEEQEIADFLDWVKSQMKGSKPDESSEPSGESSEGSSKDKPSKEEKDQAGESEPVEAAKKKAALDYLASKEPDEIVSFLSKINERKED